MTVVVRCSTVMVWAAASNRTDTVATARESPMKTRFSSQRFLAIYSGVVTMVFAVTVLAGFAQSRQARFETIDVERINVREPDGTIRLVLSSKARLPGLYFGGTEYDHPNRETAGMLFYNDEGTETGGITFGGATAEDGTVSAYGHVSFDQYEQDQVLTLDASESGGNRKAAMAVWDRPDWSMEELIQLVEQTNELPDSEQRARISAFFAERESAHPRMYLGKSHNGSVSLRLNDREGRERLILEVAPDGTPALRMLDADGSEVARFPAAPR